MIYRFIDDKGAFIVENPKTCNLYFPLTDSSGRLLGSISPNLAGDIKQDNDHFLTIPASIEDLRSNLLCRRDFFIKTKKEVIRLSFPYEDTVEAGLLYHKVIKKIGALHIEILNFIPHDMAVEVMRISVTNKGKAQQEFIPTSFIPLYARAEKNLRDHRHVSSLLNRLEIDSYGLFIKPTMIFDEKGHTIGDTIYFALGFENNAKPPAGQFPTLDCFFGEGDILNPDAIEKNAAPSKRKKRQFDGKEACAAFRFSKKRLASGQTVTYTVLLGIDKNKKNIKNSFLALKSPKKIDEKLQETKKYWREYLGILQFDFKNKNFNNWLLWVKLQPKLRKLFGCSFLPHFDYGKGGRGWRDLWQDALALLLTEPDKTKNLIVGNFRGVRIDGSNATIITKEGDFLADRNQVARVWMDHGVWPYITLRLYIHRTADIGILLEETTYFRDHLLKRAKEIDPHFSQRDCLLRTSYRDIYSGTILEHLLSQHLVQFFNVGEHNLTRLENADWNDGLDMAPWRGESVTFSSMYAYNLRDLCTLLEKLKEKSDSVLLLKEMVILLDRISKPINYGNFKEKQKRLEEYLEMAKSISGKKAEIKIDALITDLKEKAGHLINWIREREWLREGFFNGYYDNCGARVEGKIAGRIRMMLPSQVFSIMSGVASEQQVKDCWRSIKKHLKDARLGGLRLNTDFGLVYFDLGRAFGFSYGDKENGAFFNHMAVMCANALYKRGFIKEGFEVLNSIYEMATHPRAQVYPLIPEYFNNDGKGLYSYLTGSASWYIYTLLEEVLGIKFIFGDIVLGPKLTPQNFYGQTIEVAFGFHGKKVHVSFIKGTKSEIYSIKEVVLQGRSIMPSLDRYIIPKAHLLDSDKDAVEIKVYFK